MPREEHNGWWRSIERDFDNLRERVQRSGERDSRRLDRLEERYFKP